MDNNVPEHRDPSSSSHELASEPGARSVIGKAQHFYSLHRTTDIAISA